MTAETYSPISHWAVISVSAAILAVASFLLPVFMSLTLIGMGAGLLASRRIATYQHRGIHLARIGFVLSLLIAPGATTWHSWLYNSEAPAGYTRLDFAETTKSANHSLDDYLGQNVCLKGYAFPGSHRVVDQFLLTVEGEARSSESAVWVTLPADHEWRWSYGAIAVSGRLVKDPHAQQHDARFRLEDSSVRAVRSQFGLAHRRSSGC